MTAVLFAGLATIFPLLAALLSVRSYTTIGARRIGTTGMLLSLGFAIVAAALSSGWVSFLPAFVAAIGLTAVSMSPAIEALRPATISRILIVNGASAALVLADDPAALALAWLASVLPVWLELRARREARQSAGGFAAYMVPSTVLVIAGAFAMSLGVPARHAGLALAAGLAIRAAMVPMHSWLPRFVERAPMGLVVAFVSPQVGVYAHLRWLIDGLPPDLEYVTAALGAITVVYGAALGVVQRAARRALGYFLMSQTALVAFGFEAENEVGRSGALLTWLVCGLATAGLAMTMKALEARRGALTLDRPSGSFRRIPHLASAYLVLGLASVGLPGTLGFVAEDLLVAGSVERFPVLGMALVVGTALNAITIVKSFFALFTGTRQHAGERDLTIRERATLSLLLVALLATGLVPSAPLRWLHGASAPSTEAHP